jgi:ribonuclease P protein component
MLKKINRALKREDFADSRELGVIYQSPLFGVSVIKNLEQKVQFGFVISRKIAKSAVVRNKIKRYIAEALRKNLGEWKDKNLKVIFLFKKNILEKKSEEIDVEVIKIIKKINEKDSHKITETL